MRLQTLARAKFGPMNFHGMGPCLRTEAPPAVRKLLRQDGDCIEFRSTLEPRQEQTKGLGVPNSSGLLTAKEISSAVNHHTGESGREAEGF
jgi:hypothetical protein